MKKIIFAALMAVFTLCSVAAMTGGPTCRVRGNEDTIASIDNTRVTCAVYVDGPGVKINVTLSKPAKEETYVVVEIYDGNTCLGSEQIKVNAGFKTGGKMFYSNQMKKDQVYTVTLSNAYCM